ncbi:MAG: hypothetical protein AMJ79_05125 [Phycisphaerae bacterium SM23_30]|nr:MAG: hypothetical protein AMJ79_05125 [Phycisphaerae bacterium SM23_30]
MTKPARGPRCDVQDQYQLLKPYPGGRAHTCTIGGRSFSMTPASCLRQRARAQGIYYNRVLIGRRGGKPVIFEYDGNGRPVDKLSCAPKAKRSYYQVKDTLFFGERDKKVAERLYPQLRQFWDSKLMQFLTSDLVAGPSQSYKIGYVIVKIEPSQSYPGDGMVHLQAVLQVGKSVIVLEEPRERPLRWLNDDFVWFSKHAAFMQMAAFSETVLQIVVEVTVSRGSGAIGRFLARKTAKQVEIYLVRKGRVYAVRKYLEKKFSQQVRKRLVKAGAALGKATVAFAKEFASSYATSNSEKQLMEQLNQGKLTYHVLYPAISRASGAFTTTLISETLGSGIDTVFEKSEIIKTEAGKFISARITKLFTVDTINNLTMAISLAAADVQEGKAKSLSEALPQHLVAQLKQVFLNEVKASGGALAQAS